MGNMGRERGRVLGIGGQSVSRCGDGGPKQASRPIVAKGGQWGGVAPLWPPSQWGASALLGQWLVRQSIGVGSGGAPPKRPAFNPAPKRPG